MIVSLTAFRRPYYLNETLQALKAAREDFDEQLTLVVSIEPSDEQTRMIDQCRGIADNEILIANGEHLGLQANNLKSISRAFEVAEEMGEDYVLGLSEDIVISSDALHLTAWMRENFRDNQEVILTSLYSGGGEKSPGYMGNAPPPEEYNRVVLSTWFQCQGWGAWLSTWKDLWLPKWNQENRSDSWDSNVNMFVLPGKQQVIPRLSRCRHIGLREGEHSRPENFEIDLPYLFAGDVEVPDRNYWYADS